MLFIRPKRRVGLHFSVDSATRHAASPMTDHVPRRSPALLLVHLVWATARRRPLLEPSFDETLIGIVGAKARDLGCLLLAAGCGLDHLHAVLRLAPTVRLADLVHRIKGGSAYDVNHHLARRRPLCWQAGYWAESSGPADLDPLVDYVRNQRLHHDLSHPAERWQFGDQ
jgi:REP element-mobilizing transposase RayT